MMSRQSKGFAVSMGLHLVMLLLLGASVAHKPYVSTKRVLDLRVLSPRSAQAKEVVKAQPRPVRERVKKEPLAEPVVKKPEVFKKEIPAPVEKQEPEDVLPNPPEESPGDEAETVETPRAEASASSGPTPPNGRDFSFIKKIIQKNLRYPGIARRKGWEGKVVVTFIICPDGKIKDVAVLRSSGKSLLDRNAMEVVRRSAPFPRQARETSVTLPIVYELKVRG